MRLRYTLLFALFFLVGPAKAAPKKTDRDRDGLKGPVRSILRQHSLLSQRNGKIEEGGRYDLEFGEYDTQGKKINYRSFREGCDACLPYIIIHDSDGRPLTMRMLQFARWPIFTIIYHYDAAGNVKESDVYDSLFGNPSRKWTYQYEYDSYGNWIKKTDLLQDPKFSQDDTSFVPRERDYRVIYYAN